MANRFPGEGCVVCDAPSVGVGEHVWPQWFLQEFAGEGPFYTEKSGEVLLRRDATPATHDSLQGVHVPMCERCNARLDKYIEKPAKDALRRLMPSSADHVWPVLTPDECAALAFWFLKVGLLLGHPKARHDNPHLDRDPDVPRLPEVPADYLRWMTDGSWPPRGFSVFACRRSIRSELEPWPAAKRYLQLPEIVRVPGHELRFMVRELGIKGVDVTIVWHPGWPIAHPLVAEGRAVRLWPDPNEADFAQMPEVHKSEFGFVLGGAFHFSDNEYQEHLLPALAEDLNWVSVLDFIAERRMNGGW